MRQFSIFSSTLLLCVTIFSMPTISGQHTAKDILRKVITHMENTENTVIEYNIKYFFPSQEMELIKGKYWKKGDLSKIKLGNQEIYALKDGIYDYNSRKNLITIQDRVSGSVIMSPESLIKEFSTDNYTVTLSKSRTAQHVLVFTPLNKNSQYTLLRLNVDKKSLLPVKFFIAMQDATRIHVEVLKVEEDGQLSVGMFQFDPKNYPNAQVEDLRF